MTGFDHLSSGTPEQAWIDSGLASSLPPLAPPLQGDRLLILAAHPDDETLGAGGLMCVAANSGADVAVVVASDGEASHPRSPTTSPTQLAKRRRDEVRAAVAELAPGASVQFLGLPDGGLESRITDLRRRVRLPADGITHLASPWRSDRHPDHEACAEVADAVAREVGAQHWQYPIWAWHWDDPAAPALPRKQARRLELDEDVLQRKRRALACHRSQHTPLSAASGDEAILPAGILAHFTRSYETFLVESTGRASRSEYFDELYASSDDPWGFESHFYEARKRAILMASLPRKSFGTAFEPGCATGLLTELLAPRCERVIAWDVSRRALELAAERTRALLGVHYEQRRIPEDWPTEPLDLVVLSEVGYYAPNPDELVDRVLGSLSDDGVVVACHWRHAAPDHPRTAGEVHDVLGRQLAQLAEHTEADFLLHVWTRTGISVARAEGLLP